VTALWAKIESAKKQLDDRCIKPRVPRADWEVSATLPGLMAMAVAELDRLQAQDAAPRK
jgi:hypothetical protein